MKRLGLIGVIVGLWLLSQMSSLMAAQDSTTINIEILDEISMRKDVSGLQLNQTVDLIDMARNGESYVDFGEVLFLITSNVDWDFKARISDFVVTGADYNKEESDFKIGLGDRLRNVTSTSKFAGGDLQSFATTDTDELICTGDPTVNSQISLRLASLMALGVDVPAQYEMTVTYTLAPTA